MNPDGVSLICLRCVVHSIRWGHPAPMTSLAPGQSGAFLLPGQAGASVPRFFSIHINPQARRFDLIASQVKDRRMEPAITSIVNTYVRVGNRRALQELWRVWSNLRVRMLELPGGYDPSQLVAKLDSEMTIIEAGIDRLSRTATEAALPPISFAPSLTHDTVK